MGAYCGAPWPELPPACGSPGHGAVGITGGSRQELQGEHGAPPGGTVGAYCNAVGITVERGILTVQPLDGENPGRAV